MNSQAPLSLETPARPALGIGSIIGDSFSLLFRNVSSILQVGFVPTTLAFVLSASFIGMNAALGLAEPGTFDTGSDWLYAGFFAASIVTYTVVGGILIQAFHDLRHDRPLTQWQYLRSTFAALVPLTTLGFLTAALTLVALLALVVPGLWVGAVFSVFLPALLIERAGFGSLRRSIELTRGYRWPIALLFFLDLSASTLLDYLGATAAQFSANWQTALLLCCLVTTFALALSNVWTVLVYLRLKEIKEGMSTDRLASVFE